MGHLHGRLIVFDLDGTVIDSRRDLTDSANQLIAELGGAPLSEEAVGLMVGEGAALLVKRALDAAGLRDDPTALARFLEIYDIRALHHTVPYEGIVPAIQTARHFARVALLTNKLAGPTERLLDELGLRALFDDVVGGDGAHPRKPDPASLLMLMAMARAEPAGTLLVGDSRIDHQTALRGGARCCLARYGFGAVTIRKEELSGDEWTVDAPNELPDVFQLFTADE